MSAIRWVLVKDEPDCVGSLRLEGWFPALAPVWFGYAFERTAFVVGLVIVPVLLFTACVPRPKSVELANPCDRPVSVRVWDQPHPADPQTNDSFIEATVGPLARVTVEDAVTVVGKHDASIEITSGPGRGEVLSIPHGSDRFVIIPATFCA